MASNFRYEFAAWGNKAHPCKSLLRLKASLRSKRFAVEPSSNFQCSRGASPGISRPFFMYLPRSCLFFAAGVHRARGHVIARRSKSTQHVMAWTTVPESGVCVSAIHPGTTGFHRSCIDRIRFCRTHAFCPHTSLEQLQQVETHPPKSS